jgi:hypothetical protein
MDVAFADHKCEDIFVLVTDPAARFFIPKSRRVRIISSVNDKRLRHAEDILVLTTGFDLPQAAEFIKNTNQKKRVRGLLVRQEANQNWLSVMLERAGLRNWKNLLVYSDYTVMRRVLGAWGMNYGKHNLIADAAVIEDILFVRDCIFNCYEVELKQIKAFAKVPTKDRGDFLISEKGGHISWPAYDIDLGLDSIKYILNPESFKALARNHGVISAKPLANSGKP